MVSAQNGKDRIRMNVLRVAAYALSACAAGALLAACASAGSQSLGLAPSAGAASPNSNFSFNRDYPSLTGLAAPVVHRDLHKSWVSPDAKRMTRLLFISDADSNDVYIFAPRGLKLEGTLTGFDKPAGLCSDKSGNIWIVNNGSSQIELYSRAGTLLKTIDDSGYWPVGCSVNSKNGDLAVANIRTTTDGTGNVMIYPDGSEPGSALGNPVQTEYYYPAYDTNGNLYVDGRGGQYNDVMISICPAGGSCSTLNVSGATLNVPGGLNWNKAAGDLVVNDPDCGGKWGSCLYSMSVSGSAGTVTRTTSLYDDNGDACVMNQWAISPHDKNLAGGCIAKNSSTAGVARWKFAAGGKPTDWSTSVEYPVGAAISK
jgi:hypothetical protein